MLRPITVLIGPNGAGKSTIVQALMLLRQSLGQTVPIFRRTSEQIRLLVDLVGFDECVHRRDSRKSIHIGFSATVETSDDFFPLSDHDETITCVYDAEFAKPSAWPSVVGNRGAAEIGAKSFSGDWRYSTAAVQTDVNFGTVVAQIQPAPTVGKPVHVVQWKSVSQNPTPEVQQYSTDSVQNLIDVFARVIDSWRFVPAIRGFPYSSLTLHKQKSYELRPAEGYDVMAADLASTMAYDEDLERTMSTWIEKVTNVRIEHGLDEGPGVTVKAASRSAGRNIPLILEGFGTNQLTFLMFQIAAAPKGGLIAIEEPETHLHPIAIAKLGDLFAEIALQERKQLLLTTHSDHLLLSLLNNVAEKKLSPDDLAIYYVMLGEGETIVRRVEVTTEGMVKGGLPGFFDAALEAQRRHLTALAKSP